MRKNKIKGDNDDKKMDILPGVDAADIVGGRESSVIDRVIPETPFIFPGSSFSGIL